MQKRYAMAFSFSVLAFSAGLWFLCFRLSPAPWNDSALSKPSPEQPPAVSPQPALPAEPSSSIFAEWLAIGSGCRARSSETGDVMPEPVIVRGTNQQIHVLRFHLDHFQLSSQGRASGAPLDFARECAIRIQVGPPAGKRIKAVKADTKIVFSKSENSKLILAGVLKLGAGIIGQKIIVHDAGTAHHAKMEPLHIVPDAEPEHPFPQLQCAERKLLGFDYTWIAQRKAATDDVSVKLSGEKVLELAVELEDCS